MFVTYEAKNYSKGRTTVMGIAALLIVWFHSCIVTKEGSLLSLQKQMSDIGVDMFFFASGVGVYFAWKKYRSFVPYFVSRIQRVMVPFLIVAIPWFAYQDIILAHSRRLFLKDVTMLTFWTEGRMTFWFVSAILLLYVLTPLYMHFSSRIRSGNCRVQVDLVLSIAIYAVMILVPMEILRSAVGPAMIFLPRIPVYLIGLWFGTVITENRVFRIPVGLLAGVLAACGLTAAAALGYLPWTLPLEFKYLAYGPAAVILSCSCSCIPANKFWDFFGKRSLEIYLLLEKVQVTLGEYPKLEILSHYHAIPFFALCAGVTLILVELVRFAAAPFQKPFWRKKT